MELHGCSMSQIPNHPCDFVASCENKMKETKSVDMSKADDLIEETIAPSVNRIGIGA